jgi:2-succinyl-5-enolpyruvyl-6-hydroxy-3-cyclohexene-1-carboxylate synthase
MLVVAGSGTEDPEGLAAFAARAGIPLLADPPSRARQGGAAVAHYDLLLRDPGFRASHRPKHVFRVGALPTSKPLRAWLAELTDAAQVAVDPWETWQDPDAVVGMRLRSALPRPEGLSVETGWLDSWLDADRAAGAAVEAVLGSELSEPAVARALGEWLPADTTLFVASSMPIRDTEEFIPVRAAPPRVLANRGANGIDGTVSSAFGAAAADAQVVLLVGDVALAHDVGGLLAARRLDLSLTIVLLNNDGGGIFHFLPVAGESDAFEEHVATPHGLDFGRVAAVYGCEHRIVDDIAALRAALEEAGSRSHTTILEVRTERNDNLALHRRVSDAVADALAHP